MKRRHWLLVLFALVLVAAADARLGGGQTYSGGGSSGGGSGGGGGGDAELIAFLLEIFIRLCIQYPEFGVPICGVLLVIGFFLMSDQGHPSTAQLSHSHGFMAQAGDHVGKAFEKIAALDPNFSRVVFLDFVNSLYSRVNAARGHGTWEPLRPYMDVDLYNHVKSGNPLSHGLGNPAAVNEIVLGSITPVSVNDAAMQVVRVRIRANYVEEMGGQTRGFVTEEFWTLRRPRGTLSPHPDTAVALGCPSCGAKVELDTQGVCTFCDSPVVTKPVGWQLFKVQVMDRRIRPPVQVGPGGMEAGTLARTIFQSELAAKKRALVDRHPDFEWGAFKEKVRHVFLELQAGWTAQDPDRIRPYESDALYATHRMWIERYKEQQLVNHVEDVQIGMIQVARIELDAYYESITVRVHARCKDFTTEVPSGKVVGGSKEEERQFSEYWTLIRSVGAAAPKAGPGNCPSCGAPLDKVNQAGVCEYCDAKIVSGRFGWVLAWIEQDEEYAG